MTIKPSLQKLPVVLFIIFLLSCTAIPAQLWNDSTAIRIMNGSSVVCIGNFTNARGSIINDGKLEVRGSFTNRNIYNSVTKEDSLLLTGTGTVILNSGSATFNNLYVNKPGGGVTLAANTTVGAGFALLAGSFSTDPANSYELIAPVSATFSFEENTSITGKVRRTGWINGDRVIFHQPGMSVKTTGGTAPATLLVNMIPGAAPTLAEKAVKRYFYFNAAGGGNYTADITFPYSPAELNTNNEANLLPWYYVSYNNWSEKITGNTNNTATHSVISTGIKASMFANSEWKLSELEYDSKNPDLFVYPLPAKNTMNIILVAEKTGKATIKLLDVSGKVCKVLQKDTVKGLNKLGLNIAGLSAGEYILKVEKGNAVQTRVVLIE